MESLLFALTKVPFHVMKIKSIPQLERLQKENADEWGKRERIETERFTLERENKKLRTQIQDLEEQLERKSHHASAVVNTDMKSLQNELSDKNKVREIIFAVKFIGRQQL